MVHKYIFQLIVHTLLQFHKQYYHIYVCNGLQYKLDCQHMDCWPNIDQLRKYHQRMDFRINLVGIYKLDHLVLQYKQLLHRRYSHCIL